MASIESAIARQSPQFGSPCSSPLLNENPCGSGSEPAGSHVTEISANVGCAASFTGSVFGAGGEPVAQAQRPRIKARWRAYMKIQASKASLSRQVVPLLDPNWTRIRLTMPWHASSSARLLPRRVRSSPLRADHGEVVPVHGLIEVAAPADGPPVA